MPDGSIQDAQENKEKFNLERFQDLKSSQNFGAENGSNGKKSKSKRTSITTGKFKRN